MQDQDPSEVKASWDEIKVKLKLKFAKLTNTDLLFIEDKKEKILKRLQTKLGITKEEIEKLISEL